MTTALPCMYCTGDAAWTHTTFEHEDGLVTTTASE